VLVMTLALLVLASTLLVTIGRSATQRVLLARSEQRELQRRWGAVSCRSAVLPYASQILARQEALQNRPVPSFRAPIRLGDQRVVLIVSDEEAKANVNAVLQHSDKSATESRLREALSGSGLGNTIMLHPQPIYTEATQPTTNQRRNLPQWISGFGQIFADVGPDRLVAGPGQILTCWGNGAVNRMRVSDAALRLAAAPTLTNLEIGRLLEARNKAFGPRQEKPLGPRGTAPQPNLDAVSGLVAQARIDPKARVNVALVSSSTCYSLWIITQERQHAEYRLCVSDDSNAQFPRIESFVW
jgi:hypothetical protein